MKTLLVLTFALLSRDEAELRTQFAKDIKEKDAAKRVEAVKKLAGAKEEKTIELLAKSLKDAAKEVRKAAAEAIEASTDSTGVAVKVLAEHLKDKKEEQDVRLACAKALAKSPYKHDPIEAMIYAISNIDRLEKHLHQFGGEVTDILDKRAEKTFNKERNTPELWGYWWTDNKDRLKKEDDAVREKLKK